MPTAVGKFTVKVLAVQFIVSLAVAKVAVAVTFLNVALPPKTVFPSKTVPAVVPKFLLNAVFLENAGSPLKLDNEVAASATSDKLFAESKSPPKIYHLRLQ